MADSSLNYVYMHASKRKRLSYNVPDETQISAIKETRLPQSEALRLDCKTIEIRVGSEEEHLQRSFHIHEFAICDHWAENRPDPRVIELPEDDPAAFALYMQWIYTRKLPVLPEDENSSSSASPSDGFPTLAYAAVLAERLLDNEFKKAITDAYVLFARGPTLMTRRYPSNEDIRIIYEGTNENASIRKLLLDIWYARGKHEWIERDSDLPKDFLIGVTAALLKSREDKERTVPEISRPWKNTHEQYYDQ